MPSQNSNSMAPNYFQLPNVKSSSQQMPRMWPFFLHETRRILKYHSYFYKTIHKIVPYKILPDDPKTRIFRKLGFLTFII